MRYILDKDDNPVGVVPDAGGRFGPLNAGERYVTGREYRKAIRRVWVTPAEEEEG